MKTPKEFDQDIIRIVNMDKPSSQGGIRKQDFLVFKLCNNNEDDNGSEDLDTVTEYISSVIRYPFLVLTRDIDLYVEKGDSK